MRGPRARLAGAPTWWPSFPATADTPGYPRRLHVLDERLTKTSATYDAPSAALPRPRRTWSCALRHGGGAACIGDTLGKASAVAAARITPPGDCHGRPD